jgi:hypothetical protein
LGSEFGNFCKALRRGKFDSGFGVGFDGVLMDWNDQD